MNWEVGATHPPARLCWSPRGIFSTIWISSQAPLLGDPELITAPGDSEGLMSTNLVLAKRKYLYRRSRSQNCVKLVKYKLTCESIIFFHTYFKLSQLCSTGSWYNGHIMTKTLTITFYFLQSWRLAPQARPQQQKTIW